MVVAIPEVEANFDHFSKTWQSELNSAVKKIGLQRSVLLESYARISAMNAWRVNVLDGRISEGSLEFFAEAVNDAVASHVFAHCSSWRTALMSLRSCVENVCFCLYYKDHPIELRLWEDGKHRPGFTDTHSYLEHHPDLKPFSKSPVTGLGMLKEEYSTLSRAVHASAKSFRMIPNAKTTALWKPEIANLGQWKTREMNTLAALNLLLVSMFRDLLQGSQQSSLRTSLYLAIPQGMHLTIKKELKITLRST